MEDKKYEILLDEINDKKEVLFGKFSEKITLKDKEKEWQNILDKLTALGHKVVPDGHSWKYLRDTVWATNLKSRTLVSLNTTYIYLNNKC